MPKPLYCIAHRGGPGPENSVQAIRRSLALKVDMLEVDIWHLHGELFAHHDRRWGGNHPHTPLLTALSPTQLAELRLDNNEPLPTLENILTAAGNLAINIEIKNAGCAELLAQQLHERIAAGLLDSEQVVISSFDHHELFACQKLLPKIKRGVLLAGIPLDYAACCEALNAYSFHSVIGFTNAALVADVHRRGLKHWVYTANHPDEWLALSAMGVDGVFTDVPAQLMAWRDKSASGATNS